MIDSEPQAKLDLDRGADPVRFDTFADFKFTENIFKCKEPSEPDEQMKKIETSTKKLIATALSNDFQHLLEGKTGSVNRNAL